MFGLYCEDIPEDAELEPGWDERPDPTQALQVARYRWWQELDRYTPEALATGSLMTCWGDPTEPWDADLQTTGGDCSDASSASHRDAAEGPGDLLSRYEASLDEGLLAEACATCLDGLDNNCDGQIDCEDPGCAACFVGQGMGCSEEGSPCKASGCASTSRRIDISGLAGLALLALLVPAVRRRRDSSGRRQ